jgi:hypothetical protein
MINLHAQNDIENITCLYSLLSAKKQESADSSEPPPGEAIIPTLPDVKMCAAKAIARSARSGKYIYRCICPLSSLDKNSLSPK